VQQTGATGISEKMTRATGKRSGFCERRVACKVLEKGKEGSRIAGRATNFEAKLSQKLSQPAAVRIESKKKPSQVLVLQGLMSRGDMI